MVDSPAAQIWFGWLLVQRRIHPNWNYRPGQHRCRYHGRVCASCAFQGGCRFSVGGGLNLEFFSARMPGMKA